MSEVTARYRLFFKDSNEGQEFVKSLHTLINAEHEAAESNPELSRDHTQRAKGIRLALQQINIVCTEAHKSKA